MEPSKQQLHDILASQRVLVVIGSGGVGKTTLSAALAVAAAQLGRRVALLSIDPAKRLASALGLQLGHELSVVKLPLQMTGDGTLAAAMLDQKAMFDSMVLKHAPSERIARKILNDPLYLAASTNLSGPLEYMALAKLQELFEDPSYDLIVVDTPPDHHALDFLARPNFLSAFMEHRVIGRLLKPAVFAGRLGLGKLAQVTEKLFGGLGSVTGVKALQQLGEFMVLMQDVIDGFHQAGEKVKKTLVSPSTSFALVMVPSQSSKRSTFMFIEKLTKLGFSLDLILFNRCLPAEVSTGTQFETYPSAVRKRLENERLIFDEVGNHPHVQSAQATSFIAVEETDLDLGSLNGLWGLAKSLL